MVACHGALISREDRAWRRRINSSTARRRRNKGNPARGHAACLARSSIVRIERTGTFEKSRASGIRVLLFVFLVSKGTGLSNITVFLVSPLFWLALG